jgi:hypothetical protein
MDPSNTELVRVRIINGASLTSYKVFLPGNSTIIKADGSWVVPKGRAHVWVGVGQRYEVLVRTTTSFILSAVAETFSHVPLPHERTSLRVSFSEPLTGNSGDRRSRDAISAGATGSSSSSSNRTGVHAQAGGRRSRGWESGKREGEGERGDVLRGKKGTVDDTRTTRDTMLEQLEIPTGNVDDSIDAELEQFPPFACILGLFCLYIRSLLTLVRTSGNVDDSIDAELEQFPPQDLRYALLTVVLV